MPVIKARETKSPSNPLRTQPGPYMWIIQDIRTIIKVNKCVISDLPIYNKYGYYEKQTD
jgi:hypothetical protein